MKKIMIVIASALVLAACGTENSKETVTTDSAVATVDTTLVATDSTTVPTEVTTGEVITRKVSTGKAVAEKVK